MMKRISASYVFASGPGAPLKNGYVEYAGDGTIISVGECKDPAVEQDFHAGCALTPGFVNSHCHVELSHLHGKFIKGTGMAGFIDQINELRDSVTVGEKRRLAELWMEKMWNDGVSAMADISNCDDSFWAKQLSPVYTRTFLEVFGTEPEDCMDVMNSVSSLQKEAEKYGIDAAPTPHSCYTTSPELLTASAAAGLKSGFLSYHSQESPEEEELLASGTGAMAENRKKAGMSTPPVTGKPSLSYFIDRMLRVHEPPFDEHVLLVHNVCLTQEAIDAARKVMNNVYWAVCPLSNIFIHNALPPLDLMRRNGLDITVGTDSLSSNDDLDMVKEMFCIQTYFPGIPLAEILTWACMNGARFLSKERELGSLEEGKRPGIVLIDNISEYGSLTAGSTSRRII